MRPLTFIAHRSPFTVHRSSFIAPRRSFIVSRRSFIVPRSTFIVLQTFLQTLLVKKVIFLYNENDERGTMNGERQQTQLDAKWNAS
jgi:hypothetical protein